MATPDERQEATRSRVLYGRTVQSKNEIYTLPVDGVEMERLIRQHRTLTLAIGSLYWPKEEVRKVLAPKEGARPRVLDIGSGSGAWAVAMAKEFPHIDVLGCDLSPMKPRSAGSLASKGFSQKSHAHMLRNNSDAPANCSFQILDLLKDNISHLEAKFDLVHCRFLALGIQDFRSFLRRVLSLVKPGGLFSSVEPGLEVYGKDKKLFPLGYVGQEPERGSWLARILVEFRDRVMRSSDYPPGIVYKIPEWLTNEGFADVQTRKVFLPINWSGPEDEELQNREEVVRLNTLNIRELPASLLPSLLAAGVPSEEGELWLKESRADIDEKRIQIGGWSHFFIARAP